MTQGDKSIRLEDLFPQNALDAVPQPMWVYGPDGVVAGCNVAVETFWRLPREHMVGKYNAYEHAATPQGEGLRELVRALRATFAEGTVEVSEPVLIDVTTVDSLAGVSDERAYMENTFFPLRDAEGVIRFVAVLQRDVTELVEKRQAVERAMAKIAAQDELIAALEAAQSEIVEQQRTIEELSTPIIQVWEGVLAVPILGAVDGKRATEMMHKLLEEIVQTQAEFAILDLTGVHGVDAATAHSLARILKAVTLLGTRGIVSGVSPSVAEALTSIEVDTAQLETCRNLRDALVRTMRASDRASARSRRRPGHA